MAEPRLLFKMCPTDFSLCPPSQFVPFRDYIDRTGNHVLSMARLAKDVLAEIPDQFLSYMRTRGIKPSPAPPPYTPTALQTQIWGAWRRRFCCQGLAELYTQNTSIYLKPLSMPARCGSRRSVSCSESCRPGECCFQGQDKSMGICLLPLSSIPVGVWIFVFWLERPGQVFERFRGVLVQARKKRSIGGRNGRRLVGQLVANLVKRMSLEKSEETLDLQWTFFCTELNVFSLSLNNSLIVYSKHYDFYCWYFSIHIVWTWSLSQSLRLSWHGSGSRSGGPGSPLYRTLPYRTVPYCFLVFILTFCMSVASVKCMHIVALHYLLYLSISLWKGSVCLPVCLCHAVCPFSTTLWP